MPHVVGSIVNDVDMRKADHAHDENPENHRQQALQNGARTRAGKHGETDSIRFLQDGLQRANAKL